ncbi:hypothetical protein AB6735_18710 [Mucilaginibacter sp. RCC_168]|uniref:phage major capsid protein n=1 Tax=Mucilaginibacter sp. RCC_168 TaxID=3239221 RepID=UPI0035258093
MPGIYPELWLNRVETRLVTNDTAPWLSGIPEIASQINEVNAGSGDSEQNQVHIPATDFEVDILINNTTYPIPLQSYTDTTITIQLDKYQTKRVTLTDDQTIGSAYNQIDAVTNNMVISMAEDKYAKAIHSLAPASNAADTPVLQATGRSGILGVDGEEQILKDGTRLRLTYKDLVDFKAAIGKLTFRWPKQGRRLVLCENHWNDLLLDRKNFGDKLVNYNEGDVAPRILGFDIYSHGIMPHYNGTTKLAWGALPTGTQYEASVAFHVQNVGMKTGLTKQYFLPSNLDPANQANTLSYRHYFIVVPKRARYIAAIVSPDVP